MSQGASALFVGNSDDLIIMQRWTVWRVSELTGLAGVQLDLAAGSDFYDPNTLELFPSRPGGGRSGYVGFLPHCIALSADGARLAIGGNDAQLVLFDSASLQPLSMRVRHLPFVDAATNGVVQALAFSPDHRMLASVANDDWVVIGDARTGDPLAGAKLSVEAAREYARTKRHVCWSADGTQLAVTNSEGRIEIFDVGCRERH